MFIGCLVRKYITWITLLSLFLMSLQMFAVIRNKTVLAILLQYIRSAAHCLHLLNACLRFCSTCGFLFHLSNGRFYVRYFVFYLSIIVCMIRIANLSIVSCIILTFMSPGAWLCTEQTLRTIKGHLISASIPSFHLRGMFHTLLITTIHILFTISVWSR